MPNYIPVSKETHASKRWKRTASFAFAAKDAVAPLVAQELPSALTHLPMGFIKQEEIPLDKFLKTKAATYYASYEKK